MDKIKIEGIGYYLLAKRADRNWGHGVNIEVRNSDHELLGNLSFCCHPEFEEFDLYQSYETDILFKIASERIAQDLPLGKYKKAWESGFTLGQRFNGPVA